MTGDGIFENLCSASKLDRDQAVKTLNDAVTNKNSEIVNDIVKIITNHPKGTLNS